MGECKILATNLMGLRIPEGWRKQWFSMDAVLVMEQLIGLPNTADVFNLETLGLFNILSSWVRRS
jgi:hypothetical protein